MVKGSKASVPVQADIARKLGISVSTISRALADSPKISEDVKIQVRDAAAQLGYDGRRAERRGFDRIIVLLPLGGATSSLSIIYEEILNGIKEGSRALHSQVEMHMRPMDEPLPKSLSGDLNARTGLLFVGLDPSQETLADLRKRGIPTVLANGLDPRMGTDCVAPANFFGGRTVAEYLVANGHRKLLYVFGHRRWTILRRQQGFESGAEEFSGRKAKILSVFDVRATEPDQYVRKIANFCKGAPKGATALFCSNDTFAIYAIQALHSLGLSVPEDMSVIGFDDIPMATMISPNLTTVRIEWREIGREAMHILRRRAASPGRPPMQVQVGGHLIARDSVRSIKPPRS